MEKSLNNHQEAWHVAGPGFSLTVHNRDQVEEIRKVVASYCKTDTSEVTATKVLVDIEAHPDAVVKNFTFVPFQQLVPKQSEPVRLKVTVDSPEAYSVRKTMAFMSQLESLGDITFIIKSLIAVICDSIDVRIPLNPNLLDLRQHLVKGLITGKITEQEVLEAIYLRFQNT